MNNYGEIRLNESCFLRLKRFLFVKLKDKTFLKANSTVIGASSTHFLAGAVFSVIQLLLYQISCIHWKNPRKQNNIK